MDTTERMMIMGMCLQGLLANPALASHSLRDDYGPEGAHVLRRNLIKLAHQFADELDPPASVTAAQQIAALTRIAYEAVRAADADGAGKWVSYHEARVSLGDDDLDRVDGVFERVSRWFHDPTGYPETVQDRIIAAVVAAGRE